MWFLIKLVIKLIFKLVKYTIILTLLSFLFTLFANGWLIVSTTNDIATVEDSLPKANHAIVLGASVLENKTPSPMLAERLDTAIDLYNKGKVDSIILSGGNLPYYNEVGVMYTYAINHGIPYYALITDSNGMSTKKSIINYKANYPKNTAYIITQRYHLYRAVYLAKKNNLSVKGIASDTKKWGNSDHHQEREYLSRINAFVTETFPNLPKPIASLSDSIKEHLSEQFN